MNKKRWIIAITLMLAVTGFAMAGGGTDKQYEAAALVHKGEYFENQFELFKNPPKSGVYTISAPAPTQATPSSSYERNTERPPDVQAEPPSEQDIDRAIACFEEALKLFPSGTWKVPSSNSMTYITFTSPPPEGVKASLARAQRTKRDWIATGKSAWEESQRKALEAQYTVKLNAAGDGAVITKYSGDREVVGKNEKGYIYSSGELIVPATIQGFPVKEIGDGAFSNKSLTRVVIPEGVTRIGSDAFRNNRELIAVTIPSTVTSVGKGAFSGCPNLDVPTQLALRKLGYTD